jgi:hypothetical protein
LRVVEVGGNARKNQLEFFEEDPSAYVTTAFLTVLPSLASEISFILVRTMEEISWGENCLVSPRYSASTNGDPSLSTTVNGQCYNDQRTLR